MATWALSARPSPSGLTASNFNLAGTSSLAANTFLRFDENAAINDATANRVWRFNRFNITSNNVATLGEVTNIALRGAVIASLNGKGTNTAFAGALDFFSSADAGFLTALSDSGASYLEVGAEWAGVRITPAICGPYIAAFDSLGIYPGAPTENLG